MKRWSKYLSLGVFLAVTATGASGCDKMVHATVVSEKSDSETGETFLVQRADKSVKQQVNAPDYYVSDTEFEQFISLPVEEQQESETSESESPQPLSKKQIIQITANAPVIVPDVNELHIKKVKPGQIEEETLKYWVEILSRKTNRDQNQSTENEITEEDVSVNEKGMVSGRMTVNGLPYYYHYQLPSAQKESNPSDEVDIPFIWAMDLDDKITVSDTMLENTETGMQFSLQTTTIEDYVTMTDELLKEMGFDGLTYVRATDAEENELSLQSSTNGMITLEYGRIVDGVLNTASHLVEYPLYDEFLKDLWYPEILQVTYMGGIMEGLDYMGPTKISDYSSENVFLLPFEEIHQIFQNTIGGKMCASPYDPYYASGRTGINNFYTQYPNYPFDHVEINIKKVMLQYMRKRDTTDPEADTKEGLLIPVWDFMGTWTAYSQTEDGQLIGEKMEKEYCSLLTIDARDGTILQRMVGE